MDLRRRQRRSVVQVFEARGDVVERKILLCIGMFGCKPRQYPIQVGRGARTPRLQISYSAQTIEAIDHAA